VTVALADKIDTLTGFWMINLRPTGSKDPFALRRAALGAVRLTISNELGIGLIDQFKHSLGQIACARARSRNLRYRTPAGPENAWNLTNFYEMVGERTQYPGDEYVLDFISKEPTVLIQTTGDDAADISEYVVLPADFVNVYAADLLAFLHDRLKVFLRDRGIRHDVIDACLAMPNADDLTLFVKRAEALSEFLKSDDGENLLLGFKRAHNILTQAEERDGVEYSYGADIKFAEADEEKALFAALDAAEAEIAPAMEAEDFSKAMAAMAGLRAPIDAFFEAVQVNAESEILRRNRLNLIHRISSTCLSVADLTRIEG